MSPPDGASDKPRISTGVDGGAVLTRLPLSFTIARTLPTAVPAITKSPTLSVPFCTRTVATGPLPLSISASITVPCASLLGLAFSSCISATRSTISKRPSMLILFLAEISTQTVSPPHSSGTRSYSTSICLTLSGLAPSLSILLIATTIVTPAAFAWLIASIVCGIIPSSAATTSIATSVTCAPLARIVVNAS